MRAPILCPFCDATAPAAGGGASCGVCGRSLVLLGRWRLEALLARGDGTLRYAASDVGPAVDAWVARKPAVVDAEGALAAGHEDGGVFVVIRPAPQNEQGRRNENANDSAGPSGNAKGSTSTSGGGASAVPLVFRLIGMAALVAVGIGIGLFIRRSPDAAPATPGAATASVVALPGDPLGVPTVAAPAPPSPEPEPVAVETAIPPSPVAPAAPAAAPDWSRGACAPVEDCYTQAKAWGSVNGTMTVSFDGKGKPTFVSFTGPVPYAVQTCLRAAGMADRLDGYAGPPAKRSCTFSGNIVRGTGEMMFDSDFQASKR